MLCQPFAKGSQMVPPAGPYKIMLLKHYDIIFVFCNFIHMVQFRPGTGANPDRAVIGHGDQPFASPHTPNHKWRLATPPTGNHDQVI